MELWNILDWHLDMKAVGIDVFSIACIVVVREIHEMTIGIPQQHSVKFSAVQTNEGRNFVQSLYHPAYRILSRRIEEEHWLNVNANYFFRKIYAGVRMPTSLGVGCPFEDLLAVHHQQYSNLLWHYVSIHPGFRPFCRSDDNGILCSPLNSERSSNIKIDVLFHKDPCSGWIVQWQPTGIVISPVINLSAVLSTQFLQQREYWIWIDGTDEISICFVQPACEHFQHLVKRSAPTELNISRPCTSFDLQSQYLRVHHKWYIDRCLLDRIYLSIRVSNPDNNGRYCPDLIRFGIISSALTLLNCVKRWYCCINSKIQSYWFTGCWHSISHPEIDTRIRNCCYCDWNILEVFRTIVICLP